MSTRNFISRWLQTNSLNLLKGRTYCLSASLFVLLFGLAGYWVMADLNYGIDFKGGVLVQVQAKEAMNFNTIRSSLSAAKLGDASVQRFGDSAQNEYLILLAAGDASSDIDQQKVLPQQVASALQKDFPSLQIRRVESVGPKVGEKLKGAAIQAILFSLLAILIYIWLRFKWKYAISAVLALFHDVGVVLTVLVWLQTEISLPVVAALLTVAGYSINDTIVIFDRVRENMNKIRKQSLLEVMNNSIQQTLGRTMITSGTTMFVLLSLYLFGGAILQDFALTLLVGVVVGTYSSIFVAVSSVYHLMSREASTHPASSS